MKSTVKVNAQALVAPGRFVVGGLFQRSENASGGQGFLVAHLVSVLVPDAFLESFSGVWRSAFAAIRLPRRRSFRERERFLGVLGFVSSVCRR